MLKVSAMIDLTEFLTELGCTVQDFDGVTAISHPGFEKPVLMTVLPNAGLLKFSLEIQTLDVDNLSVDDGHILLDLNDEVPAAFGLDKSQDPWRIVLTQWRDADNLNANEVESVFTHYKVALQALADRLADVAG